MSWRRPRRVPRLVFATALVVMTLVITSTAALASQSATAVPSPMKPAPPAIPHLLAQRFIHARTGGVVSWHGVKLQVPPKAMSTNGWATIVQTAPKQFDVHIWVPWTGHVRITLPTTRGLKHNVVLHSVGSTWQVESPKLGVMTVSVSQLSVFTTIGGLPLPKTWEVCAGAILALPALAVPGADVAEADAVIDCLIQYEISRVTGDVAKRIEIALGVAPCAAPGGYLDLFTKSCVASSPGDSGPSTIPIAPPAATQPLTVGPPVPGSLQVGPSPVIQGGSAAPVQGGSSPASGSGPPLTSPPTTPPTVAPVATTSPPPPPPPPPAPSISAVKGGVYGCGVCHTLDVAVHNFPTGTFTYYCHDNSGPAGSDTVFFSHAVAVTDANQGTWPGVFCYDSAPYVAYVVINGVRSNSVQF